MSKPTVADLTLAANTIRCLSIDAIEAAGSGHPGLPMGLADVAAVLWLNHLKHDPEDPSWADRDRFVLSGGHGSMLLYSLLHLSGYDLSLDDIRRFRQLGGKTPGHPERGVTAGVETTTGPLGQGLATAVGMALAERMMAARVNKEGAAFNPVDHRTFVFCGDGDLMEGISHEACSLAGRLGLDRLVVFFDSNGITIEGPSGLACSDDVGMRFKAYGWRVLGCDGHDHAAIDRTIRKALRLSGKPTLVVCRTTIGMGSPNKAGSAGCHGAPLGADEVRLTKRALGFDEDAFFFVPPAVRALFAARAARLHRLRDRWMRSFKAWARANPEEAAAWRRHMDGEPPENLESALPSFDASAPVATRAASGRVINALAAVYPPLVGGSADLGPSNKTEIKGAGFVGPSDYAGRNIHFGVRELAMSCVACGLVAHGGFRAFCATFFVFSDYCKPAIRVAALMKLPVVFVFSHDSFYVGEDGPTHEPVEQLPSLRCIPGVVTIRPADATETAAAWLVALRNTQGPTAILLTRQGVPTLDRSRYPAASNLAKGAYVLWQNGEGTPDETLIGTGSEVALALEAARRMGDVNVRVVSMPSWELFERQPQEYRDSVLDPACPRRLVVEAASSFGWARYAGPRGAYVTLDRFGKSAPYKDLAREFGFTVGNVVEKARAML